MIKIRSGQIIYNIRTTLGVAQEELCLGLCSVSTLSKYETGERVPDSLLFYTFIQRLGKSADRVSIMISNQEAKYYEWKKRVFDAIEVQNWKEVKRLREWEKKNNIIINEKLQAQFGAYLDAILALKIENNVEKFYESIKEAIEFTIPLPDKWDCNSGLIGSDEINLLLLYLSGKKMADSNHIFEIKRVFEQLELYVEKKIDDIFEKTKIYPRIVCTKILLVGAELDVEECIWQEKRALQLLKRSSEIYDMPELLRLLIRDLKKNQDEKTARIYEKQREALVSVMEDYGAPTEFRLENWHGGNERICLMNEYLSAGRKQKKLTQEELSEGVCAVETYSRIESGKRAANRKNYLKLAERLDMNWGYYRGQIITEDYRDFLLMTEQRIAVIDGKVEEAKILLNKLKNRLDMSEVENCQYVELMELDIKKVEGGLSPKQTLEEAKRILRYTVPEEEKLERFYTKTEIEIIENIVPIYQKSFKDYEEAIRMIQDVLENDARGRFSSWIEVGFLKRMLASIYSDTKEYEKSIEIIGECIREMLKNQDGQMLPESINLIAWNLERWKPEKRKDCDNLYVKAFYLTDLFQQEKNHQICKEYYEKNFDANKKWY